MTSAPTDQRRAFDSAVESFKAGDTHGAFSPGVSLPPSALASLPHDAAATLQQGITHGASHVFLAAALASIVGLLASLLIKQVTLRGSGIPEKPRSLSDTAGTAGPRDCT